MGLKFYGIGAAQNPDKDGQTIIIKNLDTTRLRYVNDEHGDKMFDFIGGIVYHKKIYSEADVENEKQRRCWQHAKVPFLYVEGELADDEGHPNAQAAASLIKFTAKRPEYPLKLGLSIEGGILEKTGEKQNILSKTIGTGTTITVKPCNPKCVLFPEIDLMKSDIAVELPIQYVEKLQNAPQGSSIKDLPLVKVHWGLLNLKKSLEDYMYAFTDMKCHNCGKAIRFFKSTRDIPNGCERCGNSFRLADIWKALNK